MVGRVVAINRSHGGVPKLPVRDVFVGVDGLEGDSHVYHRHGGPDKAVCLYSLELIEALQREGHPIAAGTTGENVTVKGLDWARVVPGVRLSVGAVQLEITEYTTPCQTIIASFADARSARISQKLHPGWARVYARVLAEGILTLGDPVSLV